MSDPIVVNGPKGSGPITAEEFGKWIIRSGITLTVHSFHPINDNLRIVQFAYLYRRAELVGRQVTTDQPVRLIAGARQSRRLRARRQ